MKILSFKKVLVLILLLLIVIVYLAFLLKDYSIEYTVNEINVKEKYESNRYYFEIDNNYIMDIYSNKKLNKKMIDKIEKVKDGNYECLLLTSDKLDVYPLCRDKDNQISYDLVNNEKLEKHFTKKEKVNENNTKSFEFFNNLDKNTYIAIWKYNGFYILNENNTKTLNIFKNDRYSNDLSVNTDKYIFVPDYDSNHTFNSFYVVDLKDKDYKKYDIDFDIDFDSYILGQNEEFVYLYDTKFKVEYEFNLKKGKVSIIGNEEEGYVTYKNSKIEKTTYNKLNNKKEFFTFDKDLIYNYSNEEDKFIKTFNDNKNIKNVIYDKKVDYIDFYLDKVFFLDGEYLYLFTPISGSKKIVRNFEWNFNKENTIFIYSE